MMLTAGESPMWVAQQMGHSDWGMIRRVYGRWDTIGEPGGRESGGGDVLRERVGRGQADRVKCWHSHPKNPHPTPTKAFVHK
jgi:hypothetical protein